MKEHYIDSRFREELDGLEANPPVEAWLAISDALDLKRKKQKKLVFFRTAAAMAILLVTSFSFWMSSINESATINELLIDQAMLTPLQPSGFHNISASDLPIETISKKPIEHLQPLYIPSRDEEFPASTLNGSSFTDLPTLVANSLTMSSLSMPTIVPASNDVIKAKHPARQARLIASTPPQRNRNTTISFGMHMAPQYNYRYLANSSLTEYKDIPFESLENQLYTYSAGLSALVKLSPDWTLQTGLNYNNTGQFIDGIVSYHHPDNISLYSDNQFVITSLGGVRIHDAYHHFEDIRSYRVLNTRQTLNNTDIANLHKTTEGITQVLSFIEIPLLVRYNVYRQHIGIDVKGGVAGNYLIRKDVFMGRDIFQNPIGETYGVNQFNFSVIGGFALKLPITGNIILHIEPTAQFFLQPVVLEGLRLGNAVPYNFSLQTGFSYSF